jgi:hypothetical protein
VIGGIGGSGRRNLHQSLQDEGPEDGFGTEDFAARALDQIFFSDSNESLGAATITKEVVEIHILLTRSLFADDILRRLLRRASVAKPTSAPLRF